MLLKKITQIIGVMSCCSTGLLVADNGWIARSNRPNSTEVTSSVVVASTMVDIAAMTESLFKIRAHARECNSMLPCLESLCTQLENGAMTAALGLIEDSLEEAMGALVLMPRAEGLKMMDELTGKIEAMYSQLELPGDESMTRSHVKTFRSVNVQRRLTTSYLVVRRDALVNNDLTVGGSVTLLTLPAAGASDTPLSVNSEGIITRGSGSSGSSGGTNVVNNCQSGPLKIGTNDGSTVALAAGSGACTARLSINSTGNVSIEQPDSGKALTIAGSDVNIVNGNVILPAATPGVAPSASPGLVLLGGDNPSSTNISMFEVGDHNLFIGNYASIPVASSSGTINIGSPANPAGASQPNTIAIGNNATTNSTTCIAIGNGPTVSGGQSIGIGTNASALNSDSIAIGTNASTGQGNSIALGRLAAADGAGSISIGSASNASPNGSIALGDNTYAGGSNSVAIGINAAVFNNNVILLGSVSNTAIGVGIGTQALNGAKLNVTKPGGSGAAVTCLFDVTSPAAGDTPLQLSNLQNDPGGTSALVADASGKVYRVPSSKRYKTNIRSITGESKILYDINPVIFDYNYNNAKNIPGFIAEELYEKALGVNVVVFKDGHVESLNYQCFHALAIKEIQNHQAQLEKQDSVIRSLQERIAQLEAYKG